MILYSLIHLLLSNTNIYYLESKQKDSILQNKVKLTNQLKSLTSEELYKSVTGEEISFNSSTKLQLNLSESTELNVLTTFGGTKTQLPDLRRIWINKLKDSEASSINEFLRHSTPNTLPILALNIEEGDLIKVSLIKDGLVNSVSKVTEQVRLDDMEFKPEEVEEIIKGSSQSKELLFVECKLPTKKGMDLSCNNHYLTQFLSFDNCGDDSSVCMEWDKYPERFEHFIEAISKCTLKTSLKKINIDDCDISKKTVEGLLKKYSLDNIQVVEQRDSVKD